MNTVFYAIPVAEDPEYANQRMALWRKMGFNIAVFRDIGAPPVEADILISGEYAGYPKAVNALCRRIFAETDAVAVCTGGTDIDPDPTHSAQQIARDLYNRFPDGFGLIQATGDRWMIDAEGRAASERVCGSPFMGKAFCQRVESGRGPFCENYWHFYCDERLQNVAQLLGVLWQRPDLAHFHHHWSRERRPRPPHLSEAKLNWPAAKEMFERDREQGFPGHQPLEAAGVV